MTASYTFTVQYGSEITTLPLPSQERGIEMEYFPIGVSGRTADATYRVQHIANKWRVRITWAMLDADERATVLGVYGGYIALPMTVTLPDGFSFIGFVDLSSWVQAPWHNPHRNETLYNVSFTIVEA